MKIKGTQLFTKALKEEGITTLFGYPGGFAIDIFDALYDTKDINVILPRHEQALVHAADGYARATGRTGVCLVTSGPGATNMITGIATAYSDSIPLVCFTGQVPTGYIGKDVFQEADIVGMTSSITKYSITVRNREDLGPIIKKAFYLARSGRPGPVVIDLPKDIMLTEGTSEYPKEVNLRKPVRRMPTLSDSYAEAAKLLDAAKRPLLLAGGGIKSAKAEHLLLSFIEKTNIPVVTTILGRGSIPTTIENYIGNIGMHGHYASNLAIQECDLLLAIGTRFNDRITCKIDAFAKNAKIIHIDIDETSISKNIQADIGILDDAKEALEKLLSLTAISCSDSWKEQLAAWKQAKTFPSTASDHLTALSILQQINESFIDPIVATDVGQHQMWTAQHLRMTDGTKLLTSGGFGTMGYGLPAAIGAQLGCPLRQVLCITGDGGMQMNIQELATAVTNELPLLICIFNNSYLGMVRQWQQMFFNKRYSSTCLRARKSCEANCGTNEHCCPPYTPDFVKLAESYGAAGIRVFDTKEVAPAFLEAQKNKNKPTIIEFMLDPDDIVYPMVPGGRALQEMVLE